MKLNLLPLALGGLTIGITEFVVMGLLPDIASDLNVSIPQAGHLIAAYALGVVVGAPLLVIAGRNVPPKKMLLWLAVMLAVFNATSIFAPDYDLMLASRFLSGLPHGAFFGVGAVVASRLAEKGKEARSIAFMFSGLTFANVVGVPLGTFVGHNLHWRYTFVIIAIIGVITVLSMWRFMPNLQKQDSGNLVTQLKFFSRIEAWLLIFITAIGFGGLFSWISYIAPLLTEVSGFAAEQVPYLLVVAGLGMVAGNFAGGRISDAMGPSRAVIATLLLVASVLTADYFLSGNKIVSIALVFLTGCAAFSVVAPINMLVIGTAKGSEMIASATIQASFNIGNALGAYLGGLPLLMGFGYESPNLVGVGMALIGAVIALVFLKINKEPIVFSGHASGMH
ncbi:MFS transporter [Flavobacterium silvaticum]|uniref:MFS transporter n=1 Tax=Flavobacterium silvaticum TaxID=1852020 RepID=A0A972FQY3_9FLAO|nr:MFS transporter [Flavobacterium silvaticum]NMH26858.1 MFS transporter [Flavobacterium silvaticum]